MSEFEAGTARHVGGRRVASAPEEAEQPEVPEDGRRRKPLLADETETSADPAATSPAARQVVSIPEATSPTGAPVWPFTSASQTASQWVAPVIPTTLSTPPAAPSGGEPGGAESDPRWTVSAAASARSATPVAAPTAAPTVSPVEQPLREPATEPSAAPTRHEPTADATAPNAAVLDPPAPAAQMERDTSVGHTRPRTASGSRRRQVLAAVVILVWLAAVVVSGGRLAAAHELWSLSDAATRIGSVSATWLAIVVLARRCGGRYILIGLFAALVLGIVAAYPENWALAGAGVTAASVHGVLGMTLSRPAAGLRTLRELLISALIGAAGAVVVSGYDVVLRPFRFRVMVLALVLLGGFALAWRLGHGARSLGRRGIALITGGVLVLALSVAYTQAIRAWGSPGVIASVTDSRAWLEAHLGAVPRPIEALVGFPALVWGVAIRSRRRQGWWMCAFGGLGAAGVATSLIHPATPFVDSLSATGYGIAIGAVLGLILVLLDRLFTGRGGRRAPSAPGVAERPEPPRFSPLL